MKNIPMYQVTTRTRSEITSPTIVPNSVSPLGFLFTAASWTAVPHVQDLPRYVFSLSSRP